MAETKPDIIALRLMFPPSVNHYWRYAKLKHMKFPMHMVSESGRRYTDYIRNVIIRKALVNTFTNEQTLKVVMHLYPPTRQKRDVDNYSKGLFDALSKAGFWGDDAQVKVLHIEMRHVVKNGYVDIGVCEVNDPSILQSSLFD